MSGRWIAQISEGCWLAPWGGDPGRTIMRDNATRYKTAGAAKAALTRARKRFGFRNIKGSVELVAPEPKP